MDGLSVADQALLYEIFEDDLINETKDDEILTDSIDYTNYEKELNIPSMHVTPNDIQSKINQESKYREEIDVVDVNDTKFDDMNNNDYNDLDTDMDMNDDTDDQGTVHINNRSMIFHSDLDDSKADIGIDEDVPAFGNYESNFSHASFVITQPNTPHQPTPKGMRTPKGMKTPKGLRTPKRMKTPKGIKTPKGMKPKTPKTPTITRFSSGRGTKTFDEFGSKRRGSISKTNIGNQDTGVDDQGVINDLDDSKNDDDVVMLDYDKSMDDSKIESIKKTEIVSVKGETILKDGDNYFNEVGLWDRNKRKKLVKIAQHEFETKYNTQNDEIGSHGELRNVDSFIFNDDYKTDVFSRRMSEASIHNLSAIMEEKDDILINGNDKSIRIDVSYMRDMMTKKDRYEIKKLKDNFGVFNANELLGDDVMGSKHVEYEYKKSFIPKDYDLSTFSSLQTQIDILVRHNHVLYKEMEQIINEVNDKDIEIPDILVPLQDIERWEMKRWDERVILNEIKQKCIDKYGGSIKELNNKKELLFGEINQCKIYLERILTEINKMKRRYKNILN